MTRSPGSTRSSLGRRARDGGPQAARRCSTPSSPASASRSRSPGAGSACSTSAATTATWRLRCEQLGADVDRRSTAIYRDGLKYVRRHLQPRFRFYAIDLMSPSFAEARPLRRDPLPRRALPHHVPVRAASSASPSACDPGGDRATSSPSSTTCPGHEQRSRRSPFNYDGRVSLPTCSSPGLPVRRLDHADARPGGPRTGGGAPPGRTGCAGPSHSARNPCRRSDGLAVPVRRRADIERGLFLASWRPSRAERPLRELASAVAAIAALAAASPSSSRRAAPTRRPTTRLCVRSRTGPPRSTRARRSTPRTSTGASTRPRRPGSRCSRCPGTACSAASDCRRRRSRHRAATRVASGRSTCSARCCRRSRCSR